LPFFNSFWFTQGFIRVKEEKPWYLDGQAGLIPFSVPTLESQASPKLPVLQFGTKKLKIEVISNSTVVLGG
jgi:hypothetical protein